MLDQRIWSLILCKLFLRLPDDNDEIGSDVDRNEDNVSPVLSEREEANVVAAKVISCPFYFPP